MAIFRGSFLTFEFFFCISGAKSPGAPLYFFHGSHIAHASFHFMNTYIVLAWLLFIWENFSRRCDHIFKQNLLHNVHSNIAQCSTVYKVANKLVLTSEFCQHYQFTVLKCLFNDNPIIFDLHKSQFCTQL